MSNLKVTKGYYSCWYLQGSSPTWSARTCSWYMMATSFILTAAVFLAVLSVGSVWTFDVALLTMPAWSTATFSSQWVALGSIQTGTVIATIFTPFSRRASWKKKNLEIKHAIQELRFNFQVLLLLFCFNTAKHFLHPFSLHFFLLEVWGSDH